MPLLQMKPRDRHQPSQLRKPLPAVPVNSRHRVLPTSRKYASPISPISTSVAGSIKHYGAIFPEYDKSRQLRVVAATFPVEDQRWALRLPFGAGIAGRAYKRRKTRLFVKQRAVVEGAPFYFVPADGAVVSSRGDEIAEEVVLSFPLSHPKQPEAVYAVLSLSSRNRGSKLVNLTEEALATKFEQFRCAVVESCFEAIRQAILDFR